MYFITTVNQDDTRCVGYYSTFDAAAYVVENNMFDLYEAGCYPYAVIECIKEGVYQYDFSPTWYKFNETSDKYEKSEQPEFLEFETVGYAIG